MTDEEIKKLAERIVKLKGGFYVEPEKHYLQHKRIDRVLDVYESAANIFQKVFFGAVIVGSLVLAMIGLGLNKYEKTTPSDQRQSIIVGVVIG